MIGTRITIDTKPAVAYVRRLIRAVQRGAPPPRIEAVVREAVRLVRVEVVP